MKYLCDNKRHLICEPYSVENLHQMAKDLNINKEWYHPGSLPHYDIPKRRMEDIQNQCTIISSKEIVKIIREYLDNNEEITIFAK